MNHWAIILALLSAFFAALVAILGKIGLKNIDSTTATAVRSVFMTAFLLLITVFSGKISLNVSQFDKRSWLFIALSGIAGALSWLAYFGALKIGRTSAVVAIDKGSVVIAWLLALLFLSESFKFTGLIGVVLITIGIFLTTL